MPPESAEETQVQVCVRARPLLPNEATQFERQCLRVADGTSIVVGNDRTFGFDRVFSPESDGEAIFEAVGHPTMDAFLDGFHTTIMAYGQTGAGKTYTMSDLTSRCIRYLQGSLGTSSADCSSISLSVLEIYNEQVVDLLDPARPRLQLREGGDGEVYAAGQLIAQLSSASDLTSHIEAATLSRSTASTGINATSSRSHCIATVTLTMHGGHGRTTSRLNLVDLAGSERLKKAHASSATERVREGIHINGGLLALGNVIQALCDGKAHVPFRTSKLTRLLQPSLAGNSRTVMIACVSSGDRSMDETLNTLKYADRARRIRLSVTRNAQIIDEVNQDRAIQLLRAEVKSLQQALLQHNIPVPRSDAARSEHDVVYGSADSTRDFQRRVITLEEELAREKRFSRTLEEDLYRAEFCAMREAEIKRELQEKISTLNRRVDLQQGGTESHPDCGDGGTRREGEHGEEDDVVVEQDLETKMHLIKALEDGQRNSQVTIDEYQRRLKTVLQDKVRLQRELEAAEQRLEETHMETHKKENHRVSLKASYEARLRAAEVAAAEYRRRVKDAEAVLRARHADEEQLMKLRREAAALQEALQRQRNQSRQEQMKLGKLVVNQRAELTSLSRKLRELETHKPPQQQQQTPRRCLIGSSAKQLPSTSATSTTSQTRMEVVVSHEDELRTRNLEAAIASLMALDQDLTEAEREREAARNALELTQTSSETARWRRALKGFQLRLEQVEAELFQCDGLVNDTSAARRHQILFEERRSIQKKMMQLDELRPACDEAVDQLREVEERIDSLRSARAYKLKVVRSLQTETRETTQDVKNTGYSLQTARQEDNHGLRDTVRAQQMLIEELNQRITDQALLLQQLLPVSKDANRALLLKGER
jgi:hypothetical protein